jgi:hypothetical protein
MSFRVDRNPVFLRRRYRLGMSAASLRAPGSVLLPASRGLRVRADLHLSAVRRLLPCGRGRPLWWPMHDGLGSRCQLRVCVTKAGGRTPIRGALRLSGPGQRAHEYDGGHHVLQHLSARGLCLVREGDRDARCVDNACGTAPVDCSCLGVCAGVCSVLSNSTGVTMYCNTCPQGGCA